MSEVSPTIRRRLDDVDRWRELRRDIETLQSKIKSGDDHAYSHKTIKRMLTNELAVCGSELAELEKGMA